MRADSEAPSITTAVGKGKNSEDLVMGMIEKQQSTEMPYTLPSNFCSTMKWFNVLYDGPLERLSVESTASNELLHVTHTLKAVQV